MSSETVFQTEWFTIIKQPYNAGSKWAEAPFYIMKVPESAGVLATTAEDEIIMVKQFRPAINDYTLELPSGSIEPSETPELAAARELYEETGYRCDQLRLLSEGQTMTNRTDARYFTFLGLKAALDPAFQPSEDIEVVLLSPQELRLLGTSGQFRQHSVLGQLVLADWKYGTHLTQ
jgi:ADP-ribose pyrophosphatase